MSKKNQEESGKLSYKNAGVDIAAADSLVKWLGASGGFAGVFDPAPLKLKDPLWLASTDGVGTKLLLALEHESLQGLGQDLVAMCVNDLAVAGASPLFFLDYYACGRLDPARAKTLLNGIMNACKECSCRLIGGETAEMPGLYNDRTFDLAGFAVGAVERNQLLGKGRVKEGDRVIGLSGNGAHSNGFSLIRKVLESVDEFAPFSSRSKLLDALLIPTPLYSGALKRLALSLELHAAAHITGGGCVDNLARVIPDGLGFCLDESLWPAPRVYSWLGQHVSQAEMRKTFNLGLGIILIANGGKSGDKSGDMAIKTIAETAGFAAHDLGRIEKSNAVDRVIWRD